MDVVVVCNGCTDEIPRASPGVLSQQSKLSSPTWRTRFEFPGVIADDSYERLQFRPTAMPMSVLDTRNYQKGVKISKAAMKCLDITGDQSIPIMLKWAST
jgi:hypothetical protein